MPSTFTIPLGSSCQLACASAWGGNAPGSRQGHRHIHQRQFRSLVQFQGDGCRCLHRFLGHLVGADIDRGRGHIVIGRGLGSPHQACSEFLYPEMYTIVDHMANGKGLGRAGKHVAAMALAGILFVGFLPQFKSALRRGGPCGDIFTVFAVDSHIVVCRPALRSIRTVVRKTDGNLRRTLHGHLFQLVVVGQRLQAGHRCLIGITLIPVPGVASRTEVVDHCQHGPGFRLAIGHIILYLADFPGSVRRNRPAEEHCQRCQQRQTFSADPFQPNFSFDIPWPASFSFGQGRANPLYIIFFIMSVRIFSFKGIPRQTPHNFFDFFLLNLTSFKGSASLPAP